MLFVPCAWTMGLGVLAARSKRHFGEGADRRRPLRDRFPGGREEGRNAGWRLTPPPISRSTPRRCSPRTRVGRSRARARGFWPGGACAGTTSLSDSSALRLDRRRVHARRPVRQACRAHDAERESPRRDVHQERQAGGDRLEGRLHQRQYVQGRRHPRRPAAAGTPADATSSAPTRRAATSPFGSSTGGRTRSRSGSARRSSAPSSPSFSPC